MWSIDPFEFKLIRIRACGYWQVNIRQPGLRSMTKFKEPMLYWSTLWFVSIMFTRWTQQRVIISLLENEMDLTEMVGARI